MDVIATLVAADNLSDETVTDIADAVDLLAIQAYGYNRIDGRAGNFGVNAHDHELPRVRAAFETVIDDLGVPVDVIVQRETERDRKLLIADMDSTMITVECIDELADYAGLKAEVSLVTERAMRGEIDFAGALRDRVALLAGMKESVIADCLRERVKLMGGAKALVQTFRARGGTAVLVSGGFTHFTGPVAMEIGFDRAVANRLIVHDGVLTGAVEQPIVDAETKKAELLKSIAALGIPVSASMAIGDGANDIPMIEAAGLGIAYHAKPKTQAAADTAVRVGDLSVLLYAMGIPKAEWRDE
jgi:phosphoserine phosphatase